MFPPCPQVVQVLCVWGLSSRVAALGHDFHPDTTSLTQLEG